MRKFCSSGGVLLLSGLLSAQVPDFYDMDTVRDVYLQFNQSNWWQQLEANYTPEINIPATMTVDGVAYPSVGVRFRGNTSYNWLPNAPTQGWEKTGFNLSMDWMVSGQDIQGYDNLNLNNGFHDPTFLREVMTYYVMRQHGVAPKANWVRLHLNGTYWGVYINVQQPNKDMFKEWFRSNDGNRYRGFPESGNFQNGRCAYTWLGGNVAQYLSAYRVKQGDGLDLMNMCNVLNNTPSGSLQSILPDVFNVDSFLRYAAVMNVVTQTDSYIGSGKDHFLYMDEVHGDGTTLPVDCNEGMQESTTLSPTQFTNNAQRPGFTKTLQFSDWRERYKAHYLAIIEQTFNPTELTPLVQQYHAMIAPDVVADTKKIYSTAAFQQNLQNSVSIPSPSPQPGNVTVPGFVPWIAARTSYLQNHSYLGAPRAAVGNLSHTPAQPTPVDTIYVTVDTDSLAASVNLWSRPLGKFTSQVMFDDGLHGDGAANDDTWGVAISPQAPGTLIDYYVEALTSNGVARYEPFTGELERECRHIQIGWPSVPSAIVINEFVAQNQTGAVDENGQHEDWVELYNSGATTIDVGGMWLSDVLTQLKWQIPTGNQIAPGGVLRVWCDEDGTQGPLHANFKLSAGGECIVLYAATGTAIHDVFEFGQQLPDQSTGRLLDGGDDWVTYPTPTYMARNAIAFCGRRAYGALEVNAHGLNLSLSGSLQVNTTMTYAVAGGPANGLGLVAVALGGGYTDLGFIGIDETLLLSPASVLVPNTLVLSATGAAAWPFAIPPGVALQQLNVQAFSYSLAGWESSRAIEVLICP